MTTTDSELPARLLVTINDACKMLGGITRPTIYRLRGWLKGRAIITLMTDDEFEEAARGQVD